MQIEHDPEEPPRDTSKSPWLLVAIMLVLIWSGLFYLYEPAWLQLGIGALTGAMIMAWGVDITGNKVPASWRGKPAGPSRVQSIDDSQSRSAPVRRSR